MSSRAADSMGSSYRIDNHQIRRGGEAKMPSSSLKAARRHKRSRPLSILTGPAIVLALGPAASAKETKDYECLEDYSVGLHPIEHDHKPINFDLRNFKLKFGDGKVRVRYDLSLNRMDENFACKISDEDRSVVMQCFDGGKVFVFDKNHSKLHFAQIYLPAEGIPRAPLFVRAASCR